MYYFRSYHKLGAVLAMLVCVGNGLLRPTESEGGGGRDGIWRMPCSHLIETLCNKTLYFEVCISSLSAYPGALQANMSELVRIAVELSRDEARQVRDFTADVKGSGPGSCAALHDCVEVLDDMVDELSAALCVVAEPNWWQTETRVDDVKTWLSAALTNPYTCVEGFEEEDADMQQTMKDKLDHLTQVTSNALAIAIYVSSTFKWLPSHRNFIAV